jgi:hypothetical protein
MTDPCNAFIAYPSNPPTISEIICATTERLNKSGLVQIKTWEECRVGGKVIVHEICREIKDAQLFIADLTHLNANVMFELGYAISMNKRIWLLLDTSIVETSKRFDQLRILTTVGYSKYCSSRDVEAAFYRDEPYSDLENTIFNTAIKPNLKGTSKTTLLYLKNKHNTEASIRVTKRIGETKIPVIVDDPGESAVQPLTWYGAQIYGSAGVVCHFTNPQREGAILHNARYALVAGMAFGMSKSLLMLEEGDFFIPVDYRDVLYQYQSAAQALSHLEEWIAPLEDQWRRIVQVSEEYSQTIELATELRGLHVGEYVAENEAKNLTHDYFVETASFQEALHGNSIIFVGRKGSGKTANLLKLAKTIESDTRNLVCVIKPFAYELEGILELLKRYKERDQKGYVIESLWKFLIFTEIGRTAIARIRNRPSGNVFQHEQQLIDRYDTPDSLLNDEFTIRLERCVNQLILPHSKVEEESAEAFRTAISEALHKEFLGDLRIALGRALKDTNRVAILVDNLDKAWEKNSNLSNLSEFLLGLLSAARRVPLEFAHSDARKERVNVSLAVFLRSDVFHQVMGVAREPDKIKYYKLSWKDPELLLRVIDERLVASSQRSLPPAEIWKRYFTESVNGIPIRDYLLGSILPRPRDIVFFVKSAVSIAVNRGHTKVQEIDLIDAKKQYSQYAIDSILVENGVTVQTLENVLYEFVGSKPLLTEEEIKETIMKSSVPYSQVSAVMDHLCALAFLGVEVAPSDYRFAEDFQDYQKLAVLRRKRAEATGRAVNYTINVPFRSFLEIE